MGALASKITSLTIVYSTVYWGTKLESLETGEFPAQMASSAEMFPFDDVIMYIYIKAFYSLVLTHWGQVTHICISKLTIIGSDNGLSPGRRQAIIWTNAWILLIWHLGTNFSEILIEIHTFSFTKMCLSLNIVRFHPFVICFVLCLWNTASQQ